jgi:membrane-associated phospholipid phosphatase
VRRTTPPLISKHQVKVAALAVVTTLALTPFDRRLMAQVRRPALLSDDEIHSAAKDLSFLGGPGPFIVGGAFVAAGELAHVSGAASVGIRVTESVLLAASITAIGKGLSGRALPGVKTKHEFSFGRGFQDDNGPFVAFPSGHTAAAFALATAITAEAERKPRPWTPIVRPVAYALATGVAIARVYQNQHWVSDLPIAAVIGMWSASTVERRSHASPPPTPATPSTESKVSFGDLEIIPHGRRATLAWSLSYSAK